MQGQYQGVDFSISITKDQAGWKWVCIADDLLQAKSAAACETADAAQQNAERAAHALIEEFLSPRPGVGRAEA